MAIYHVVDGYRTFLPRGGKDVIARTGSISLRLGITLLYLMSTCFLSGFRVIRMSDGRVLVIAIAKEAMSVHLYAGIRRPATIARSWRSGLARPLAIVLLVCFKENDSAAFRFCLRLRTYPVPVYRWWWGEARTGSIRVR